MFEEVLYQLYFVIIGTERIFVLQDVHRCNNIGHRHQRCDGIVEDHIVRITQQYMAGVFYNWRGHLVCDG